MSVVKKALLDELQTSIRLSKEYSDKIKNAKTKTKIDLYRKKLKKNNNIIADMMIALDKLENVDYNTQNN